jgi:hypothetical protein
MVDKHDLVQEMVDKWSIKPALAQKMVDILSFVDDKRNHFGYLEAHGGNKNRTFSKHQ